VVVLYTSHKITIYVHHIQNHYMVVYIWRSFTHHTQNNYIWWCIYICTRCGATASKKLEKLARPCQEPTSHGKHNRDAYKAGKPPAGFPKWPYKQIHLRENVIVNNLQLQVDQMHRQTLCQIYVPPQPNREVQQIEEVLEDQNGPPGQNIEEPVEGSSSSDSD